MKVFPETKPSLIELTLPIMCSLLSSGHYTYTEDSYGAEHPGCFIIDNGKEWKEFSTRKFSNRALAHAVEIALELYQEMESEAEIRDVKPSSGEVALPYD